MSRKGSAAEFGGEQSDGASTSTGSGHVWDSAGTEITESDRFYQHTEGLFEKRGSTREAALAALTAMLRADVLTEECQKHETTLISRCTASLKKGGDNEASLAATLLGLHVVTLGQPSDELFEQLKPDLSKAALQGSVQVRVAAIEALSIACFVASEDEAAAAQILGGLSSIWRKASVDARVRAAAVHSWTFLITTIEPHVFSSDQVEGLLADLSGLLQAADVQLRGAAGEAVALLYHVYHLNDLLAQHDDVDTIPEQMEEEEDRWYEELKGVAPGEAAAEALSSVDSAVPAAAAAASSRAMEPQASDAALSLAGLSDASTLDDVADRMRELAVHGKLTSGEGTPTSAGSNGGVRRSRRSRAALCSTFRSLCALLHNGSLPPVKIKLRQCDTLLLDDPTDVIRINYLRRYLASGFQPHLQGNPLLHEVFDFTPATEPPERMSALEKRLFRSPSSAASKGRAQDRSAARQHKSLHRGW